MDPHLTHLEELLKFLICVLKKLYKLVNCSRYMWVREIIKEAVGLGFVGNKPSYDSAFSDVWDGKGWKAYTLILDSKVCLTSQATVLCHFHPNLSSMIEQDVKYNCVFDLWYLDCRVGLCSLCSYSVCENRSSIPLNATLTIELSV